MPAMQQSLYFPVDISEMPASTRTSFTRVDHDRPGTSGGPPVVPPLPDLNLLDGRFDGHRRIFYDYLRDGARPVTAEGDVPPGEYRMRREVTDDYIVAGDADTEEGVEVHGGQERNWDHHSPVDTPQPGSRLAAEPTTANRSSQDGASSQNSSQSGSSPELPSQISLTILLVNGKRKVMIFDSRTTVGRVKELVWNTWPNGKFYVFSSLPFSMGFGPRHACRGEVCLVHSVHSAHPCDHARFLGHTRKV